MNSGHSNPAGLNADQKVGGGRFTLIRSLGRGGMGVVWLARDERLGENVALKFLPLEICDDLSALEDLRRETLRSRRLSHPNIIRIHDLHEVEGERPFISMEYVDGVNLVGFRVQQNQRILTWSQLRPLVQQLCEALDYAHQEGIIHRDLKPANLMVDLKGRLKLADFGIATIVSDAVSRVSAVKPSGTLVYMSPQQLEGKPPQVKDDIYALGATLYELLTGRPPFWTGDITYQVLYTAPMPLEERLAEAGLAQPVPSDVAALVMACLAKEPDLRPASARAVAEWIGLEIAPPKSGVTPSHPPISPGARTGRPVTATATEAEWAALFPQEKPANPWLKWLLFFLVVMAGGVAALWWGWRPGRQLKPRRMITLQTTPAEAQAVIRANGQTLQALASDEHGFLQVTNLMPGLYEIVLSKTNYRSQTNTADVSQSNYRQEIILEREYHLANNPSPSPPPLVESTLIQIYPDQPLASCILWSTQDTVYHLDNGRKRLAARKFAGTNWYACYAGSPMNNRIEIDDLPPGQYILEVSSQHNAKLANTPVTLRRGSNSVTILFSKQQTVYVQCQPKPVFLNQTLFMNGIETNVASWRETDEQLIGCMRLNQEMVTVTAWKAGYTTNCMVLACLSSERILNEPEETSIDIHLEPSPIPLEDVNWTNSLGQVLIFIPGHRFWAGETEVRLKDFQKFAESNPQFMDPNNMISNMSIITTDGSNSDWVTHRRWWMDPGFQQKKDEPVVGVNYWDAMAFCQWLTQKEINERQTQGQGLPSHLCYRLPTNAEWEAMVGDRLYPWGNTRKDISGNYATESARLFNWPRNWVMFHPGTHRDDFPRTSEAKKFVPNHFGLYDLGGNVAEWCLAENPRAKETCIRGGSWADYVDHKDDPALEVWTHLETKARTNLNLGQRNDYTGFRVVLVKNLAH